MDSTQNQASTQNKIFIAGHRGMVGSTIHKKLQEMGATNIVTRTRSQLDLTDQAAVLSFFEQEKFDAVYLAAAKVGGIHANSTYPADFIRDNLAIQLAIIDAAHRTAVNKLLFLGSSCIYPKLANQPMAESELMGGQLEPTNEAYAVAKIAGIKMCEAYNRQFGCDFRSVMPTNLYGPNDNFHPENSHVVPALIRRFHEAKLAQQDSVVVWGSGKPKREFLHVDDMADASIHILDIDRDQYDSVTSPHQSHINVGTGKDCSIAELANAVSSVVGFQGRIDWDAAKPDGTPRKLLDVALADKLGWSAKIPLLNGLRSTYEWFLETVDTGSQRSA